MRLGEGVEGVNGRGCGRGYCDVIIRTLLAFNLLRNTSLRPQLPFHYISIMFHGIHYSKHERQPLGSDSLHVLAIAINATLSPGVLLGPCLLRIPLLF